MRSRVPSLLRRATLSLADPLGETSAADQVGELLDREEDRSVDAASDGGSPLEVTVVIPAYNRSAMLRRALESVARQYPRPPAEVIVVDDGSTEDLSPVLAHFPVEVIRHERNRGLSAARNSGVAAASHPWVALLDSDDEWLPDHLATLWPLRDRHVLVTSSALRCGRDPAEDRVQGPVRGRLVALRSPALLLYPDNFICPSSAMVRREAVLAAGGFEARQGVVEDLYMWCRLLDRGTGVASAAVSLRYHIHDEQMTRDFERMHSAHLLVSRSFAGREWWSPALVRRREGTAAWSRMREYAARGETLRALAAGLEIVRHPQRAVGVAGTLTYRLLRRRRSSRVERDGQPSIVVLGGRSEAAARAVDALAPIAVRDWRGVSGLGALARLARRPSALAVVNSRSQAVLVRLAGVRAVSAATLCALAAGAARRRSSRAERS